MKSAMLMTPVGRLWLIEVDGALAAINWTTGEDTGACAESSPLLDEAARQVAAYFAGRLRMFDVPVAPQGSAFRQRVWQAVRSIPYGAVATYGDIARDIGSAPRAVGRACGANPIPIIIPCHRVVGRQGLHGYSGSGGLDTKALLLRLEKPEFSSARSDS